MKRIWHVFLGLGLSLLLLAAPTRADDVADEADLHFQIGAKFYQEGNFLSALEHFLRSNRLVPNRNVLFNVARCYEQLGQFPNAWRSYTAALDGETRADAKKRVTESLQRIRPQVAVIDVETNPPGATIFVDRKDLGARGESPRSLGLEPGKYKVIVAMDGHETAVSKEVEVKAGTSTKVTLRLAPKLGMVRVEGAVGAEIRVGSESGPVIAVAPAEFRLPVGNRRLVLSKPGFRTSDVDVNVELNRRAVVRPTLSQLTGTLVVASDLRDALIEVDGEPKGFTPSVLTLPVGEHEVRVTLSGFQTLERRVAIAAEKRTSTRFDLAREAQVSAVSRATQRVEEAPSSVSIISGQELRAMGYPTIAEAVRGIRGLYLSDDRSYTTVGVRGFSRPGDYGNKVLILYDGHPFNDNILGQSFAGFEGRTDLEDVQRIEVVRGPGSALYGTGAFFGVINVVTHERDEASRLEVGASAVEYSMQRGRVMGYYRFAKDAGVWTSASAGRGAGRDFYFSEYATDPSGLGGEARGIDDSRLATVQGRAWWKDLTLQWFWHHRNKTLPTAEYETLFGDPGSRFIDDRGWLEARFEPKLSDEVQSLTRAHANTYTFKSGAPYDPADGGFAEERYVGQWLGLEQRFVIRPLRRLTLTLGGEGQRHFRASMHGTDGFGEFLPEDQNDYLVGGAYAVVDAELSEKLRAHLGARYDAFKWNFSFGEVNRSSFNPRGAIIAKPYDAGVSKLLVGTAFRAPSVYEIFYQSSVQRPSPELTPERVVSAELEHSHRFSPAVAATGSVFGNYVTDLVVGRGEGTETDPLFLVNSSSPVLTLGAEAEVRREFRDGWMVAAQYSFQRSRYVGDSEGLRDVPNSPMHLASVKGAVPIIGKTLSVMSRLTLEGSRYDRNETVADAEQGRTDAGLIWDVVFGGEIMDGHVRYNLGAYNIADWHYSAPVSGEFRMLTLPQAGRTLLANLNVTL
ncbi:MAG: TonB-dependent receptor [Polyangiaceae bacterium]